jgi:hypothetical protein
MHGSEDDRGRGVAHAPSELMIRQIPLVEFADGLRRFAVQQGISGFQQAISTTTCSRSIRRTLARNLLPKLAAW